MATLYCGFDPDSIGPIFEIDGVPHRKIFLEIALDDQVVPYTGTSLPTPVAVLEGDDAAKNDFLTPHAIMLAAMLVSGACGDHGFQYLRAVCEEDWIVFANAEPRLALNPLYQMAAAFRRAQLAKRD